MATVVTIMDRGGFESNTDNIAVVQSRRRRVLWVPRDVWSPVVGHRINAAYRIGGPDLLIRALAEQGIVVQHSVCLPRVSVEAALADVVVTVPVREPIRLWYPLTPTTRLQDGRKPVDFDPPRAVLEGERIHQWIGGRSSRVPEARPPDLLRIRRQQVLVRALMRQHFDFSQLLHGPIAPEISDPAGLDELRQVRRWWRLCTADQVADQEIDGMRVLLLRSPEPRSPAQRGVAAVARRVGR